MLPGYVAATGGSARAAATFLRWNNYAENRASLVQVKFTFLTFKWNDLH
jgi:hypothetical protein